MSGRTYLITGANRGIGKGLLETFLNRPNTTVIAGVRDVDSSTKTLSSVQVGKDSKLVIVKIDSTSNADPVTAFEELKAKYGIMKVDVLIANSGLLDAADIHPVAKSSADGVRRHLEVNTIGPLNLFKAFLSFLEAAPAPKFFVISSSLGSIAEIENIPAPFFTYGISKAAVNFFVRKVAFENPLLVAIAVHPGWVQTDMGKGAANGVGLENAPMTLEDSIKGLTKIFDSTSIKETGTFIGVDGNAVRW